MMDFFESITRLEDIPELHLARLLILINAFAGDDGAREIEGLTKLAKLDFFLRYPLMLEKALEVRKKSSKAAAVQSYERNSVESKMVRYKYGPWDHRYWHFLALLQAKGLVAVRRKGLGRNLAITEQGRAVAKSLSEKEEYSLIAKRARILRESLDLTATGIMRFVYDTFPEIASLQMNQSIES